MSREQAEEVFARAPFIQRLGVRLRGLGEGWLETEVDLTPELWQQHGFAHAGVVATLADHTAGGAATTVIGEGKTVLTSSYTLYLLRPAGGELLHCRGEVVRVGARLIVTQADVFAAGEHCARYLGSMSVVDRPLRPG